MPDPVGRIQELNPLADHLGKGIQPISSKVVELIGFQLVPLGDDACEMMIGISARMQEEIGRHQDELRLKPSHANPFEGAEQKGIIADESLEMTGEISSRYAGLILIRFEHQIPEVPRIEDCKRNSIERKLDG